VSSAALRRALHAVSASVVLLWLHSPQALRLGTGALAVAAIVLDVIRLRVPRLGGAVEELVPVYRDRERRRPSGALWLALGYAACAWVPGNAAVAGILAGGLADPVGAMVGSQFGRAVPKSIPGSLAVAAVALRAARAAGLPWPAAAGAALAASAVERWHGPFDDNLLVGPAAAIAAFALT